MTKINGGHFCIGSMETDVPGDAMDWKNFDVFLKVLSYSSSSDHPFSLSMHSKERRLDFRRFLESGLRSSRVSAGSFPEQRLVIEPIKNEDLR